MAISADGLDGRLKSFFETLQGLANFDAELYSKKLMQAAKNTPSMSAFKEYFTSDHVHQEGTSFDSSDCFNNLSLLSGLAIARGMHSNNDEYGFHQCVDNDRAIDLSKKTVISMMPFMYGDYINAHLSAHNQQSLQALRGQSDFVDGFRQKLLKPGFDHVAAIHDQSLNGKPYTTALIFIYEYFKHGPGFTMSTNMINDQNDMQHWTQVVKETFQVTRSDTFQSWVTNSYPVDSILVKTLKNRTIDHLIPIVGGVLALDGYPDKSASEFAAHMRLQGILGDETFWKVSDSIKQVQTYGQYVWNSWDNCLNKYQTAASGAVNKGTAAYGAPSGWWTKEPSFTPPQVHVSDSYGDAAAVFIESWMFLYPKSGVFTDKPAHRTRRTRQGGGGGGGCFRPGTKVLTATGEEIEIQNVYEGLQILTRGGNERQFGTCSDETVQVPASHNDQPVWLFGFNDVAPFFSAQHVFHTTTGLRAIDPLGALVENPWADVKQLRVGHYVLHTKDGHDYTPTRIDHLTHQEADCEYIHGIHLRQGLRSYHANGFLVHLNYPEITVKTISRLFSTTPPSQWLSLLQSAKELKPLFDRFGAGTILDALEGQLKNPHHYIHNHARSRYRPHMYGIQHITRQFTLKQYSGEEKMLKLPSLGVFDGVLQVDGEYCHYAGLTGRKLHWTRPVGDHRFEHGFLELNDTLAVGFGAITYSDDLNTVTSDAKKSFFCATAIATGFQHQTFALPEIDEESNPSLSLVLRLMQSSSVFDGPVEVRMMADDQEPAPAVADKYDPVDSFTLNYQDPKASSQAIPYTDLCTAFASDNASLQVRLPIIDRIRDAKYAVMQDSGKKLTYASLPEFYIGTISIDPETKLPVYQFEMTHPDALFACADDYDPNNVDYTKTLTFDKLPGLKGVTLPFVFSGISVSPSYDNTSISGKVWRYTPDKEGQKGASHDMVGNFSPVLPFAAMSVAQEVTHKTSHLGFERLTHAHATPPRVTSFFFVDDEVPKSDREGAIKLDTYLPDSSILHESAQKLIFRAMLYNMTDDELSYTNSTRPTVSSNDSDFTDQSIPPSLANSGARTWLKDKYIPAWICNEIANMPDTVTKDWQVKFTKQERKKLSYWWSGKGASCMCKDPAYNELNELAARLALLKASPVLEKWLKDTNNGDTVNAKGYPLRTADLTGGKRWATALYNLWAGPNLSKLSFEFLDHVPTGGPNKLQQLGDIMQLFDPVPTQVPTGGWTADNKPLAIKLTERVRAVRMRHLRSMQYVGISNDPFIQDEYQFLADTVKELWTHLLNHDKGYDDELCKVLLKDAETMIEKLNIKKTDDAATKAAAMVAAIQKTLRLEAQFMRAFGTGYRAWTGKHAKGAFWASEQALEQDQEPDVSGKTALRWGKLAAYGAMVIGGIASYIAMSWSAWHEWGNLKDRDRAKLILGAVQEAIVTVDRGGQGIRYYKAMMKARVHKMKEPSQNYSSDEHDPALEPNDSEVNTHAAAIEGNESGSTSINKDELDSAMREKFHDEMQSPEKVLNDISERDGTKTLTAGLAEDESIAKRVEKDINDIAADVKKDEDAFRANPDHEAPPAPTEAAGPGKPKARGWNIKANWARFALTAVAIGMAVASGFAIYQNWQHMTAVDKGLNVAALVVQVLSIVVELVQIAFEVGFSVAAGVMTICAFAGPLLAIIGVAFMFAVIFSPKQPPPLSKPEKYIQDHGRALVKDRLPEPPAPKLTWTFTGADYDSGLETWSMKSGQKKCSIKFKATNGTEQRVKLQYLKFSFTTGSSKTAIFTDDSFGKSDAPDVVAPAKKPTGVVSLETSTKDLKESLVWALAEQPKESSTENDVQKTKTNYVVQIRRAPPPVSQETPTTSSSSAPPPSLTEAEKRAKQEKKADEDILIIEKNGWIELQIEGTVGEKNDDSNMLFAYEDWVEWIGKTWPTEGEWAGADSVPLVYDLRRT